MKAPMAIPVNRATHACCTMARGWDVIDSDRRGLEIQRCDDCQKYTSDQTAQRAAGKDGKEELTRQRAMLRAHNEGREFVYHVTLSYVVNATGPCGSQELAQLVDERIKAAGSVTVEDMDGVHLSFGEKGGLE